MLAVKVYLAPSDVGNALKGFAKNMWRGPVRCAPVGVASCVKSSLSTPLTRRINTGSRNEARACLLNGDTGAGDTKHRVSYRIPHRCPVVTDRTDAADL